MSEDAIIELAEQRIADGEKRYQELVRKIEELKVLDREMYAAVERRARMDIGPTYKWSLTPEDERLEALGRAVYAIEFARQVAEERKQMANERSQA